MQGSIFTAFSDMIIDQMGMEKWNELLEKTNPSSGGVYTSGAQYEDSELINMVVLLSEQTGIAVDDLIESFGTYVFDILYKNSGVDVSSIDNLRDFLLAIDNVIHVEVQRLYPNAYLPQFEYEEGNDGDLIMYYSSKRKLCAVSVGLIKGASNKFNEPVTISHPECMHHGAEKCKLIVKFDA
ncbi:heme NO-binding domain-containing protein [Pseudoalteromonas sp. C2R02]|uniref:heme NO-binding domain-containing protein n=1 Tax=Pseudoalteromonas sp. C2R02 TaxID=2841565 RepID=UPI001C083621|nr:heme NO-binding domain-containing protein [Pseudoalteromonas sp. C2R02]MBU2970864.1 heme NO-binding domain-containing protein [Pseudoalteromonas sp. C2R02]